MKKGTMERSYALLKESEAMLTRMKSHWAENEEHLGKIIKFVPVKDKDIMTLFYQLPYCQKDVKT